MKARILAVPVCAAIVLLSACTPPPPPPPTVPPPPLSARVPPELRKCPEGQPPPPVPPPPRTLQQLIDWVAQVHSALLRTERARATCAWRLAKLNDLILEKQ